MIDWGEVWRRVLPRRHLADDVADELEFHVDGRVADLVREGWSEREARHEVMRRFGDLPAVDAACRAIDGERIRREEWTMWLDTTLHDVRHAARTLGRNPGFTTIVVLTLAVGIGATTAIFSVVNSVLLRPLPYADAAGLAIVWQNDRATGTVREAASTADYYDFKERGRSFQDLAMFGQGDVNMSRDDGDPRRLNAAVVTHNLASVLGVSPQFGRVFTATEDVPGGPGLVLLSDALWRSSFNADRGVIGQTVVLDDVAHSIIGVLPPDVDFPARDTDVWLPIQQSQASSARNPHWVRVIGRLAPGVTAAEAHGEMVGIASELENEFPANLNRGAFVEPLPDVLRGDLRLTLWVLLGAVFAVLLIACANVANLLLARGAARSRDTAVFIALGAGAGRLSRRFLAEGLLMTLAAGVGGVFLAAFGLELLLAMAPSELLALADVRLDTSVLAFVLVVSTAIGVGFGLIPAAQTRRLDLQSSLREGRTGADAGSLSKMRIRRLLVATQMAMAVVLLVGAGLLLTTLWNLQRVDPGFTANGVLRVDFQLPESRYPRDFAVWPDWPEVNAFHESLIRDVEALPGVEGATITTNHPLDPGFTNSFAIAGRPPDPNRGEMTTRIVTPEYFDVAEVELRDGRLMDDTDGATAPGVVILNQAAAERHFPEGDAMGQRLSFWGPFEREVIGIVENERMHGLATGAPPAMYVNMYQAPPRPVPVTLMVRTAGDPQQLVSVVRERIWSLDRDLAVFNVATMDETLSGAVAQERFASVILIIFAGVAVLLATLGVHGVLSYLVAQRTHEVGVRMALGASRGQVLRMVVGQGLGLALLGIVAGLIDAVALSSLMASLLFEVSPTDPLTYAVVAIGLALAAAMACGMPARRATGIDPVRALRAE